MPKGVEDVHFDDFKPYLAPPDGLAIPCWYFRPQSSLPETDEYVVDKIVDHRVEKEVHYWRVRWKGYGPEEDTWEPASNFVEFIQQDWKEWNRKHNISIPVDSL